MNGALNQAVNELTKGIQFDGYEMYVSRSTQGRFREEQNLQINLRKDDLDTALLQAKVFFGRRPVYAPWVELFNIEEMISLVDQTINYFDSSIENALIKHFAECLDSGAKIFVEYYNDHETRKQLETGIPVVLSRLGYKMFRYGCTWFKDWYFPEGYMEGNQKLQGEKPLNEKARERHLLAIREEVLNFTNTMKRQDNPGEYVRRALNRVETVSSAV
jgi:hypothetical protein